MIGGIGVRPAFSSLLALNPKIINTLVYNDPLNPKSLPGAAFSSRKVSLPRDNATFFANGKIKHVDNVTYGLGFTRILGSNIDPLVSTLGANTFTRNLSTVKPGSSVLNTVVAEVLPVPEASFATISGLTGSDNYVLGGNNWGVATVVEIPGLAPDVAIRDGYDTLDFSASTENLFFEIYRASDILPVLEELQIDGFRVLDDTVIIGVEGQYFSDARDDFTGMFDDFFDGRLQLAYAKSAGLGSIVFANNIENIVGGKGLNSIKLIHGASLNGTVTVPQGGQVVSRSRTI